MSMKLYRDFMSGHNNVIEVDVNYVNFVHNLLGSYSDHGPVNYVQIPLKQLHEVISFLEMVESITPLVEKHYVNVDMSKVIVCLPQYVHLHIDFFPLQNPHVRFMPKSVLDSQAPNTAGLNCILQKYFSGNVKVVLKALREIRDGYQDSSKLREIIATYEKLIADLKAKL